MVQESADILLNPPEVSKYEHLKTEILKRLTDSANQQLHKLFNELELRDNKPSQLLRRVRTLTGSAVSNDLVRIKWFGILPPAFAVTLNVVKSSPLD